MKVAIIFFSVLALSFSAPQPRKPFHEHFEEFLDLILEEAGHDIDHLVEHYMEFDEFWSTFNYMATNNFKDLVYEMESLPEFKAVIEFLENDNIDILFFIDLFNDRIEQVVPQTRHSLSGKDFSAFITDVISEFPKAKLQALYEKKLAEEEEFRTAIENLNSEEWERIWNALWDNETFQKEAQILNDNGIDLKILLKELLAVFGQ